MDYCNYRLKNGYQITMFDDSVGDSIGNRRFESYYVHPLKTSRYHVDGTLLYHRDKRVIFDQGRFIQYRANNCEVNWRRANKHLCTCVVVQGRNYYITVEYDGRGFASISLRFKNPKLKVSCTSESFYDDGFGSGSGGGVIDHYLISRQEYVTSDVFISFLKKPDLKVYLRYFG